MLRLQAIFVNFSILFLKQLLLLCKIPIESMCICHTFAIIFMAGREKT